MNKSTRVYYAVLAGILLAVEFAIALWAHGFLRDYFGDVLVIPLIYCLIRVFTEKLPRLLPVLVCSLGFLAEFLQSIHLVDLLGLRHDSALAIAIGTKFSWTDIVCYIAGMLLIYLGICLRTASRNRLKGETA